MKLHVFCFVCRIRTPALLRPTRRSAFLANHAPHIAAMDLFVVPTISCIS